MKKEIEITLQKTVAEIWAVAQRAQREKCAEALRKLPCYHENTEHDDAWTINKSDAIIIVLNAK